MPLSKRSGLSWLAIDDVDATACSEDLTGEAEWRG